MRGVRFAALGSTAHVMVADPGALDAAAVGVREHLDALDRACSRFRPDSALSQLNERRSVRDADPLLYGAVEVALGTAEATGGLVVPTLGRSIVAIGYDRTFDGMPADVGAVHPIAGADWRGIRLSPEDRGIDLPDGVRLDLGASAKAWASDRIARATADKLGTAVLVNLGGDIAVAGEPRDWRVRVAEDHRAQDGGQVVSIRSGGLATSCTVLRAWRGDGTDLHHIVDPATGLPAARVWRTVSVAASSCVAANAATTAAIVLGDRAPGWLARLDLPARLVARDRTVTRLAGWPAEHPEAA